jgi:predicted secreted protein
MATHAGSEGLVKVGANTVGNVRSYSIEETADTIEETTMGQSARLYRASLTSWSGSVDIYWDETDTTGQGALTVGSEVTLNFYPEGDDAGDTYYTGTAIVTGVTKSAAFDGMVEGSISIQGDGALTSTTV